MDKIKVLMTDNNTRKEAERHLKNQTTVWTEEEYLKSFDEHLIDSYLGDVDEAELKEQKKHFQKLYEDKGKDEYCSWVNVDGEWFFIEYVL